MGSGLGESGDTSPARIPWSTPGHSNTLNLNDIELNWLPLNASLGKLALNLIIKRFLEETESLQP